jgi:O-antigen/teichoic acid export membrane protein
VAAFLIGVFAGAKDIAVIGMGIQLVKPITFIQASVGSVIGPEISTLYAKGRYDKVMKLLNKTIIVGGLALVGGLLFSYLIGPWLITRYLGEAYLQAMPVFYMLATSYMLIVMFTGFLPISIARGEIKRRNFVVSIRFLYLGVAVAIGLNAWNAAFVQLLGALTIRVFNDWPLYRSLNNEIHPRLKF